MGKLITRKSKSKPYNSLSDSEKVVKNWRKTRGLYKKKEWSVAVLRCGTCIELAMNLVIRQELVEDRKLPIKFVDKLLRNANGIHNKYQNIYLPIMEEYNVYNELKELWKNNVSKVNQERNAVAHRGEFRSRKVASIVMENTYIVLKDLMDLHEDDVVIKHFEK